MEDADIDRRIAEALERVLVNAGIMTITPSADGSPPQVTVSVNRTHCEACGERVYADVFHKCRAKD